MTSFIRFPWMDEWLTRYQLQGLPTDRGRDEDLTRTRHESFDTHTSWIRHQQVLTIPHPLRSVIHHPHCVSTHSLPLVVSVLYVIVYSANFLSINTLIITPTPSLSKIVECHLSRVKPLVSLSNAIAL